MKMMKFLVVGCGSIGMRHLRCLSSRKNCQIMACDTNPNAEQQIRQMNPEILFFSNFEQALTNGPDLVIVAAPNELHEKFAVAALETGAHVLSEKPIAHTMESARRIVAAAKQSDRILAIGYTERFRPAFQFIQKKVHSGDLGHLVGGRAMVGSYKTLLCAKSDFRSHTFGTLLVDYTHELDMLHAIFGQVADVTCKGNTLARKKIPTDPSLTAMLLEYRSGAIVTVHMDYVQHPQRRIMEIYGDRQTLVYDLEANTVSIFDEALPEPEVFSFPCERDALFAVEHENVIQAIQTGSPVMVNGEQALESLAIAEEAIASLKRSMKK